MCIFDTHPFNPLKSDEPSNTDKSNTDWIVLFASEGGHRSVYSNNDVYPSLGIVCTALKSSVDPDEMPHRLGFSVYKGFIRTPLCYSKRLITILIELMELVVPYAKRLDFRQMILICPSVIER